MVLTEFLLENLKRLVRNLILVNMHYIVNDLLVNSRQITDIDGYLSDD